MHDIDINTDYLTLCYYGTAKLKAFSENGVLQRDKLRGTVGYMSPELILTGSDVCVVIFVYTVSYVYT